MLSGTLHCSHTSGEVPRFNLAVASSSHFCRRPSLCTGLRKTGEHCKVGKHGRQHSVLVRATQSRPLSFAQRVRIYKGAATEQIDKAKAAIRVSQPVQALLKFLSILREKLDPLFRVLHAVQRWDQARQASYAEFSGDEVKRQWEWQRRTQKEWDLWVSILNFVKMSCLTIVWMTITPVSFFWGALLPVHLSWILYDHPLRSPIFLTLLPMFLVKFPLGYPVRWF